MFWLVSCLIAFVLSCPHVQIKRWVHRVLPKVTLCVQDLVGEMPLKGGWALFPGHSCFSVSQAQVCLCVCAGMCDLLPVEQVVKLMMGAL